MKVKEGAVVLAVAATVSGIVGVSSFHSRHVAEVPRAELAAAPAPSEGGAATAPEGPAINWDHPVPDGVTTSVGLAASAGHLPFAPIVPTVGFGPTTVEVTKPGDPYVFVGLLFKFPTGTNEFPTDGRVRILESPTKLVDADLQAMADNPPGPKDHFKLIALGRGKALLNWNNGIGRIWLIRDGIMIDITGPAVSPDQVQKIAAALPSI